MAAFDTTAFSATAFDPAAFAQEEGGGGAPSIPPGQAKKIKRTVAVSISVPVASRPDIME